MINKNTITELINSFEQKCKEQLPKEINTLNYDNKVIQAIRQSNKIEIKNLQIKFKRLFEEVLQQAILQIQNLIQDFFENQQTQLFRLFKEIDELKKNIYEKEQRITDLLIDNCQFQANLNISQSSQQFQKLLSEYQTQIYNLEEKNNINNIVIHQLTNDNSQNKSLIETQINEINELKQQINKQEQQKFQSINISNSSTKPYLQQLCEDTISHTSDKSLNQNSVHFQNTSVKSNNHLIQNAIFSTIQNEKLHKLESLEINQQTNRSEKYKRRNTIDSLQQIIDLNQLLQKNILKKPKEFNNLYLYSRSKKTYSFDMDVYYNPPKSYRFNLLSRSVNVRK